MDGQHRRAMSVLQKLAFTTLVLSAPVFPQDHLAQSPPMGWNSWDSFGTTVTEDEVKANADYMAKHLAGHGWQYIVVDIQWAEQNPKTHGYQPVAQLAMDDFGRLIPAPNRFPSSAGGKGFKPLHGLWLDGEVSVGWMGRIESAAGAGTPAQDQRIADWVDLQNHCRQDPAAIPVRVCPVDSGSGSLADRRAVWDSPQQDQHVVFDESDGVDRAETALAGAGAGCGGSGTLEARGVSEDPGIGQD